MKCICILSHEVPGVEPGEFTVYEAGREYDVDDPEPFFFKPMQEEVRKK